jgi:hypothetical protein
MTTAEDDVWKICDRVAEVQALLYDHLECGKHTAADVVAKMHAILSEDVLSRAMWTVGYSAIKAPPATMSDDDKKTDNDSNPTANRKETPADELNEFMAAFEMLDGQEQIATDRAASVLPKAPSLILVKKEPSADN